MNDRSSTGTRLPEARPGASVRSLGVAHGSINVSPDAEGRTCHCHPLRRERRRRPACQGRLEQRLVEAGIARLVVSAHRSRQRLREVVRSRRCLEPDRTSRVVAHAHPRRSFVASRLARARRQRTSSGPRARASVATRSHSPARRSRLAALWVFFFFVFFFFFFFFCLARTPASRRAREQLARPCCCG